MFARSSLAVLARNQKSSVAASMRAEGDPLPVEWRTQKWPHDQVISVLAMFGWSGDLSACVEMFGDELGIEVSSGLTRTLWASRTSRVTMVGRLPLCVL